MIYVIRHGQTDLNKQGRMQGRLGMPLNATGIKQAECLRDQLKHIQFDLVFSSPQERAVQTAEICTVKKAIIDARLDVFDLGEADRLKKDEVILDGMIPDARVYKGVEDSHSFIKRVFEFMHELEAEYGKRNLNVLISGHRCTTGGIGAYFNGIPKDQNILQWSSNNGGYKVYPWRNI